MTDRAGSAGRLPFAFHALGGVGRLDLASVGAGPALVERLELELDDLDGDPGGPAERYQRRRTRLRSLAVRVAAHALDEQVERANRHLAGLGITRVATHLTDGWVSVRARAADGLATADITFRIELAHTGTHLRALASHIRVHGHLPTPGPIIADRILDALLGATDAAGVVDRPHARGLCDVEIDLIAALLWALLPPAGWRLPAVGDVELHAARITTSAIEIAFGPPGSRTGELGARALQLAAAHDLMRSADDELREGRYEEAMRGYRALLAAGGPDQPHLLERILALAAARPAWFFDGLELARQLLGRRPELATAHAALASITLAQGDAREAAGHLARIAEIASAEGDVDQATLAALAGARLLRVLEPRAATRLYELALDLDPESAEAADALVERLAEEARWPELARLLRERIARTPPELQIALRLRLAEVYAHHASDPQAAHAQLATARELAPDDPAVHEAIASIAGASDPDAAVAAWHEVARLAEARGDAPLAARAYASVGQLLAARGDASEAEAALEAALAHDPFEPDALAALAGAAATRGEHGAAIDLYERLRGVGVAQPAAAHHELALARSLIALGRTDAAKTALRRATLAGGAVAADAHAVFAELAEAAGDRELAAVELDAALRALADRATLRAPASPAEAIARPGEPTVRAPASPAEAIARPGEPTVRAPASPAEAIARPGEPTVRAPASPAEAIARPGEPTVRAAELAAQRARLLDRMSDRVAPGAAAAAWELAYELAGTLAPALAREAARTLHGRARDAADELRWIDAALATRPEPVERAALLVARATLRRDAPEPELADAIADLRDALRLLGDPIASEDATTRRRAHELEADLLGRLGDHRGRARAVAELARVAEPGAERAAREAEAASAFLAGDDSGQALPHAVRAHAELPGDALPALRREVLATLGDAAWRQRAWVDAITAYAGLLDAEADEHAALHHYRLAVAAERTGDPSRALAALEPFGDDAFARTARQDLRGPALRMFADLAERTGDLGGAAKALEGMAETGEDDGHGATATARADALYRAGELFRRADRPDDAVRCLEAALRISDAHLPALDALEAQWREHGDLERVAAILGRKVAATARHPHRQKPLLSRLGDLQHQLGRPDVALATHQRALEIDPTWRPSLAYVSEHLRERGELGAAAAGFAQLAGELPGDTGLDGSQLARERHAAVRALAALVTLQPDDAVRTLALPVLERAAADPALRDPADEAAITAALAHGRGAPEPRDADADTQSGRLRDGKSGALSLRDAAKRARGGGRIADAFAALETANHVSPGDPELVRELAELATELGDFEAAARFLRELAGLLTGNKQGETLLELADLHYDRLDDVPHARAAMREAAEAFTGTRRDNTLRLLAAEAAAHLAWDVAVDATAAIPADRQTGTDIVNLASSLVRAGKTEQAIAIAEQAGRDGKLGDGGALLENLSAELARQAKLRERDERGERGDSGPGSGAGGRAGGPGFSPPNGGPPLSPSIIVAGTAAENSGALALAAAAADRDRLLAAQRENPDDAAVLLALLAHLGDRDPAVRRDVLERVAAASSGRAQEIAVHELAQSAEQIDLREARALAAKGEWNQAIEAAERAATTDPTDHEVLDLLEQLYIELGDITAASETIGRQLAGAEEPIARAALWRRRAKLYRDALGRDAEAYRCLKEAHACSPADPEIAYQLRTAAMVRGEWALVASLLYREIAAAESPRDRGALHLELALIFAEKLSDPAQAQVNFEQALVFDPSIPAARAPLAKRYEQTGRLADAARLYEESATTARAADRAALLAAAARCRATIGEADVPAELALASRLEAAEAAGDTDGALELAHLLWRSDGSHPVAFRVIAQSLRLHGDLPALTELTTLYAAKADGDARAAAWLEVARLAEELEKHDEAARAYDLALVADPAHTRALDARGNLAFKLADWATADVIYRDLGPGDSALGDDELALRRSIIAEQLGRDSEALERAREAAAAAPNRRDLAVRVQELATRLGELEIALAAGQQAFALVPLADDEQAVATRFSLVDLYRQVGDLDAAIAHLDPIVRDHPHHARALEQLAEVHAARGDWDGAARCYYQLVPLAPSPAERAERLYRLGETVLVHLGDRDRADDVFLRASDLDPTHVPTLRRLLDVYWRADDPAALVEVASQLAQTGGLASSHIAPSSLAQAVVATALVGDATLAGKLVATLAADAPRLITAALVELGERGPSPGSEKSGRPRRFELGSASIAVAELAGRGVLDLGALRAAASGTTAEAGLSRG